ncbi:NAD(P)/FAD-dependent oxidoreductase [Actinacidiphila glaucinigra]|uniref:NAD(P)/FAD-dependent oxidoreductase n=1 Tax=Actinacidiphila glaucinigra TaxID=235986 RepID=UPI002E367B3D|nr:NAD(P)/FAD-dependent oxidoreductase [Actinacidiphila glaucinigra]
MPLIRPFRPTRPGRDRRAVLWPARDGADRVPAPAPHAAVVGGGIAGIAAAVALAERGVRVDLLEREDVLGGRAAGWRTTLADGRQVTMSRGFHAFFRQYYNLRAVLRRADPGLERLRPLADYPLRRATGTSDSFRNVPRTPPWSVLGFVALSPSFGWSGLARMNPRAALPLLDVSIPDVYERLDAVSASAFLDDVRFPEDARDLAFEVFSRSFFADPKELSAAELVLMFHIYFLGSSEGLLFDVPGEPYPQALWDPLADHLSGLGTVIRTGSTVHAVTPDAGGFRLSVAATAASRTPEEHRYDAVVLALDAGGLRSVVAASPGLEGASWRAGVERLQPAPPFLVSRYWLDRPVRSDRPGFLGTSGYGPVDNVTVLSHWEGEAARWARTTGGSVVELHAYAVGPAADRSTVQAAMRRELSRIYPECAGAAVVDTRHEWRQDCPLFSVGGYRDRPTVRTRHPRLVIAGDHVRSALPVALMERAATTGTQAANALLASWGVRGHPLWSVPVGGRNRVMRVLSRRG